MQVVPDPNVLVSAVLTPRGVCAELLVRLAASPVTIVVSPLLLEETTRVLSRGRFHRIDTPRRARYLEFLEHVSVTAEDPAPATTGLVAADPADDYLVRLVLSSADRILVSGDPHLFALAGTYPVVSPRTLLDRLVASTRM